METEKNRKELMLAELGKYCIDLSKLVFGGIILAGVMQLDVNMKILLIIGVACVSGPACMGFVFLWASNIKRRQHYGIHLFFRRFMPDVCHRHCMWLGYHS